MQIRKTNSRYHFQIPRPRPEFKGHACVEESIRRCSDSSCIVLNQNRTKDVRIVSHTNYSKQSSVLYVHYVKCLIQIASIITLNSLKNCNLPFVHFSTFLKTYEKFVDEEFHPHGLMSHHFILWIDACVIIPRV